MFIYHTTLHTGDKWEHLNVSLWVHSELVLRGVAMVPFLFLHPPPSTHSEATVRPHHHVTEKQNACTHACVTSLIGHLLSHSFFYYYLENKTEVLFLYLNRCNPLTL